MCITPLWMGNYYAPESYFSVLTLTVCERGDLRPRSQPGDVTLQRLH